MQYVDDTTLAILGHANRIEFARAMARWSGLSGRLVEEDGLLLYAASTEFPVLFNGVDRLDSAVPAEAVIAKADTFFGEMGRGYSISLRDDHPDDIDLRAAAEDAGLAAGSLNLLTRAVTNRAFEDGARACTLQASPMGEMIYARMGYQELYRYSGLARFEAPAR